VTLRYASPSSTSSTPRRIHDPSPATLARAVHLLAAASLRAPVPTLLAHPLLDPPYPLAPPPPGQPPQHPPGCPAGRHLRASRAAIQIP
jgi:hypothetical protein